MQIHTALAAPSGGTGFSLCGFDFFHAKSAQAEACATWPASHFTASVHA
jgi:hypothetical protein